MKRDKKHVDTLERVFNTLIDKIEKVKAGKREAITFKKILNDIIKSLR